MECNLIKLKSISRSLIFTFFCLIYQNKLKKKFEERENKISNILEAKRIEHDTQMSKLSNILIYNMNTKKQVDNITRN